MGSGLTIRGCTPDIRSEKVPRGVRVCYLPEEKPEIDICRFCISRILPNGKLPGERTVLERREKLRVAHNLVAGLEPLVFSSHFKFNPIKCVQPGKLRDQSVPVVTDMVHA